MKTNFNFSKEDYTDFNKYFLLKRLKTRILKVIIVVFALIVAISDSNLYAQEVSISDAEKAADTWLTNTAFHKNHQLKDIHKINNNEGEILAYRFDLQPKGYLVLTANQSLPPIIAYSFTGNFSIIDHQANPLENILIQDLEIRLAYLPNMENIKKENNRNQWNTLINNIMQEHRFEQWPPEGSTSTGGWLETNWKQSSPYNNFCPMDEVTGIRSVAGCPAIALAMIINYQKNLNGTQFTDDDDYYHNYSGRQYWIDDDHHEMNFPSFPALNVYFDSIAVKFPAHIPLTTDEKAALVFSCGVAAHQVYTSSVSGTFGVNQAYDAYLRFGYNNAVLVNDSDTSFYTQMKNNMMEGMPVHFAVLSSTGQGGHNVVTDGYNTDEYYHLNFGWGGSYNGWYLLPDEIPYNLTIVEGAVMEIGASHVEIDEIITEEKYGFTVYPNPSSEKVNICLELPYSENVKLEIRDVCGKLVNDIYTGWLNKGNHTFVWHINVNNGIYNVSINTEKSMQTKKIIIK
ncbi:MAG: thiol protease/hemagglutinin PrtT [Bacteroidales bacterium]|nr:thiol protease/hemagglutinin PrtT [Bacteroidales bacterium]